jgi:predicted component of type VI protein secretion system
LAADNCLVFAFAAPFGYTWTRFESDLFASSAATSLNCLPVQRRSSNRRRETALSPRARVCDGVITLLPSIQEESMLQAKLVVVGGDAKAAEISLALPTIIGRGRDVTLTLPHPLVSRLHCELFEKNGTLHVRDLESLNGTYVDNRRIEGTSELRPDQLLTIGNVTFRAIYEIGGTINVDPGVDGQAVTARTSHVIEFEQPASADAGSDIDRERMPVHDRKTVPGKPVVPPRPQDLIETVRPGALQETGNVPDADGAANETPLANPLPEYSVIEAMKGAGAPAPQRDDATLSEIRSLLPAVPRTATVSGIDGLETGDRPRPAHETDFDGVNSGEPEPSRVRPDDSALGSFIRKLPR